jgi:hypothetical protein
VLVQNSPTNFFVENPQLQREKKKKNLRQQSMIVKKKSKGKGKGTGKKKAVKAGPKFDYRPPTMPPPLPEVISIRSVCFYRFGFFCIGSFPDGLEHFCFFFLDI